MQKADDADALAVQLTMSEAFARFLMHAYDALLHHGVNYRTLPEYTDTAAIPDPEAAHPIDRRPHVMRYIERLWDAVNAAVRRRRFHVIK